MCITVGLNNLKPLALELRIFGSKKMPAGFKLPAKSTV
jgi:hypothetical protein